MFQNLHYSGQRLSQSLQDKNKETHSIFLGVTSWEVKYEKGVFTAQRYTLPKLRKVYHKESFQNSDYATLRETLRQNSNYTIEQATKHLQSRLKQLTYTDGIYGQISEVTAQYIVTIEPEHPDADTVSCQVIHVRSSGEIVHLGYLSNYELNHELIGIIQTLPVNGCSQKLYLYSV